MSYSTTNNNSGCGVVLLLACALSVGIVVLVGIAEVAAGLTGIDSNTVLGWQIGLTGAVLFVWMLCRNPFLRFSLLVTGTAIGMIVLLLLLNGGNKPALDSLYIEALVTGISVGVGALYLCWDLKRHPLDKP